VSVGATVDTHIKKLKCGAVVESIIQSLSNPPSVAMTSVEKKDTPVEGESKELKPTERELKLLAENDALKKELGYKKGMLQAHMRAGSTLFSLLLRTNTDEDACDKCGAAIVACAVREYMRKTKPKLDRGGVIWCLTLEDLPGCGIEDYCSSKDDRMLLPDSLVKAIQTHEQLDLTTWDYNILVTMPLQVYKQTYCIKG